MAACSAAVATAPHVTGKALDGDPHLHDGGLRMESPGELGGGEVIRRPEQRVPSGQGPGGYGVSLVPSLSSQQLSWDWIPQVSVPAQGLPAETLGALGPTAEASGTAVTLIGTTDALAIGTAGPAPAAISAARLVIMAEVPLSTLHVPHPHMKAEGQVGSIRLLLTGSGLHIAGVPIGAAMLVVLTAHSVGQLAAGPALTQAWAAGLPHWAAGVLVAVRVFGLGQGSPGGRHLPQSRHDLVPPLTLTPSQARVALRTTVLVVRAADSLWGRTAAPLSRRESAAGSGVGAAGDIITGDVPLHGLGVWRAEAGWGLLHPGQLAAFLFTGALLRVTLKSRWAAVHVVFTAHALDKRAAAPGSGRQAAAGVVIRAARLHVTLHLLHCASWQLGEEVRSVLLGETLILDQVTHGVLGAAVHVVGAAGGMRNWAAAILPTGQLTAGRAVRALGLSIWAQDPGSVSPSRWDLLGQGEGARGGEAAGVSQVTGGTTGAAVHLVFAARSLGYGAAPPGAIKHNAARGGVGALELAAGALDSTQGVGI